MTDGEDPNREAYERDLAERQKRHMQNVMGQREQDWRPCMHDACSQCCGTGMKSDGTACVHMISCPCPRCSPRFL